MLHKRTQPCIALKIKKEKLRTPVEATKLPGFKTDGIFAPGTFRLSYYLKLQMRGVLPMYLFGVIRMIPET